MKRKYKVSLGLIVIVSLLLNSFPLEVSAEGGGIDAIMVTGIVEDNYAWLSYAFQVHNSLDEAKEFDLEFPIARGMYLTNVSIEMGNTTLWGKVLPLSKAIEIYNQTVDENLTGALVIDFSYYGYYQISFNLKQRENAIITVYVEGVINRALGTYKTDILLPNYFVGVPVDIILSVESNISPIIGIKFSELVGAEFLATQNGYIASYSGKLPSTGLSVEYILSKYLGDTRLIGYSNGTRNFFGYYLAPIINTTSDTRNQFVFVIDRSGSMSGTPLDLVKTAFSQIIKTLDSGDQFNIVSFSTGYEILWSSTRSASDSNKKEALEWVSALNAGGSTNIYDSVIAGLNTFLNNNLSKALFLLSDGQPNTGTYTEHDDIVKNIRNANVGEISISTIAFGSNADVDLMADIATTNGGAFVEITDFERATDEIIQFYEKVAAIEVTGWNMTTKGAIQVNSNPDLRGTLSNGSEVVITGLFSGSLSITTNLTYPDLTKVYHASLSEEELASTDYSHLERLWAIQRIEYLLSVERELNTTSEIVDIAMYYGLVVAGHTGMVLTELFLDASPKTGFETLVEADGGVLNSLEANQVPLKMWSVAIAFIALPLLMRKKKRN